MTSRPSLASALRHGDDPAVIEQLERDALGLDELGKLLAQEHGLDSGGAVDNRDKTQNKRCSEAFGRKTELRRKLPGSPVADDAMSAARSGAWQEASPSDAVSMRASEAIVTELYRRHVGMSFRLALRYGGGDRDWAQDVVHDVFLEVHQHAARLAVMEHPGGWIYRATTSRCLNRLKRDRFLRSPLVRWALSERERPVLSPEVLGASREELGRLFAAVNELPPKQRICFWMYHVDGKRQDEIGEVLGCRKSYVSKLLARAEQAVRHLREEPEHG